MITLVHKNIEFEFQLDGTKTYQIVIENPLFMRSIIAGLVQSDCGYTSNFFLYNGNESVNLKNNFEVITDYFSIDFSNKKIISALTKRIMALESEETIYKMIENNNQGIIKLFDKINELLPVNIEYNYNLGISEYTKAVSVVPQKTYTNEIEKLDDYLKLISELLRVKVVFIVNISQIFTTDEISMLIKSCKYNKLPLIFIESRRFKNDNIDNTVTIDKDLCEI